MPAPKRADELADIAALEGEYQEIVRKLPTRSPIFLPTGKVPLQERVRGVKRVHEMYQERLDAEYRPRLRALREAYQGRDRCFIIGNGPSLNQTDLAALEGEITFAVNGFFLKAKDLSWTPTFYVVEDHLVAEDRKAWIDDIKGTTKLFPVYLGYCFDDNDDTIFFNHRPRKSYPDGFDFSKDAAEITYAGCTVTFTCMQLAVYLGFKSIYLIGVDASYDLPKDVDTMKAYGVGVLDMKSDDPNHFHPDYFGKGFRWHDPQVHKMVEAYEEARRVTETTSQRIYNATIGGKLEVFERRDFSDVLPHARRPEVLSAEAESRSASTVATSMDEKSLDCPRLLVFDLSRRGNGSATGELQANLFDGWPSDRYRQVHFAGAGKVGLFGGGAGVTFTPQERQSLRSALEEYNPEVILYRPVPDALPLHDVAMEFIESRPDTPLITWIVDDWPSRLEADDPEQFSAFNADWLRLLERASLRLSIGERMSAVLKERYGYDFEPVANGVDPDDWPLAERAENGEIVVRYAGALADNMTSASIRRIAGAVERLADDGRSVRMEIKTRPNWQKLQAESFAHLRKTTFVTEDMSADEYRGWLQGADIVVIGYNFDPASVRYIGLSMANKLPECLASGAPLLAHGPMDVATIAYLTEQDCAVVVGRPEENDLVPAIAALIDNPEQRRRLAEKAREVAFSRHNIRRIRKRLARRISALATRDVVRRESGLPPALAVASGARDAQPKTITGYAREERVALDETQAIARLSAGRRGPTHVMVDVGAHHGGSSAGFVALGWRVFCFEPDEVNRGQLARKYQDVENVTIDPRAVSQSPASGASFFRSDESSGISALHSFRDSHEEHTKVDVTSVAEIVREHELSRIDFLKIDVEGFDFDVIKGIPWDDLQPDIIECEYEDAKTLPRGHRWQDIADFLVEKGYSVYVSEWHPIERYGIAHDWRRIVPYPAVEVPSNSWGNLLAFREDPGYQTLSNAFEQLVRKRPPRGERTKADDRPRPELQPLPRKGPAAPADSAKADAPLKQNSTKSTAAPGGKAPLSEQTRAKDTEPNSQASPQKTAPTRSTASNETSVRPFYADFGDWLKLQSPELFGILQRGRRKFAFEYGRLGLGMRARAPAAFRLSQVLVWSLRSAWRNKLTTLVLAGVCGFLMALPLTDAELSPWRFVLWPAAVAILAAAAAGAVLSEAFRRLLGAQDSAITPARELGRSYARINDGVNAAKRKLGTLEDLSTGTQTAVEKLRQAMASDRAKVERLQKVLEDTRNGVTQETTDLKEAVASERSTVEHLRNALDEAKAEIARSSEEIGKILGEIERMRTASVELAARPSSLDVVSSLRAMGPLWHGGSAVDAIKRQPEVEHGHALLMAILADEARSAAGSFSDKSLIEIGTTRERTPDQSSTDKLALFSAMMGMRFVTVDMDPHNTARAQKYLRYLNPAAQAVTAKGEDYLALHPGPLDVVYLDAFDFDHGKHSEERKERYRQVLKADISDEMCWKMHETCAEILIARMEPGGFVVLDDTWTDVNGSYDGKGRLAVPRLLEAGFELVARTQKSVALKRCSST